MPRASADTACDAAGLAACCATIDSAGTTDANARVRPWASGSRPGSLSSDAAAAAAPRDIVADGETRTAPRLRGRSACRGGSFCTLSARALEFFVCREPANLRRQGAAAALSPVSHKKARARGGRRAAGGCRAMRAAGIWLGSSAASGRVAGGALIALLPRQRGGALYCCIAHVWGVDMIQFDTLTPSAPPP
eukprot:351342-Chlamydomonas_euryale.AAC.6